MTASAPHSMLPALTPDEERHSNAAAQHIRSRIRAAGGWLPFDDFMELALYAPGLGYYSAGSVKVGPDGDFVTAPEVSDLFSRCVARQCADVLAETGGQILEFGAGTGRMAAAVLESLANLGMLPERYVILEVSADLAERQRARVAQLAPHLRERVVWLDALPAHPLDGVILANEVLDALPFQRFRILDGVAHELGVALEGDAFVWQPRPRAPERNEGLDLATAIEWSADLPEGYVSEVCTRISPWIRSVSGCLHRGALLLFDYGLPRAHYYHPQRTEGTLRCYFKQRAHDDPFINIGVQDITAWVDFTRVAEAALDSGLDVAGFATQAAFLLGTGIEALSVAPESAADRARLAGEARRLLLPGEMGESFKAMALCRNLQTGLRGFTHQDLRRLL